MTSEIGQTVQVSQNEAAREAGGGSRGLAGTRAIGALLMLAAPVLGVAIGWRLWL